MCKEDTMGKAYATVTSKGQITVPAEIRAALGIQTGDTVVFELKAGYATARRRETVREVSDRLAAGGPVALPQFASDDEAIASMFMSDDTEGTELYVARRKG